MHIFPDTWEHLESISDLDEAIESSQDKLVVLFKHSKRCGISFMAEERLIDGWDFGEQVAFYHLDLIEHRSVSNAITEKLGVPHQSPQILLLHGGKVQHHASHNAVRPELIKNALETL